MPHRLIAQGAEAKILLDSKNNFIVKDRIKKSYRLPKLDNKIRKQRTKSEAKLMLKASEIIKVPKPLIKKRSDNKIQMPYLLGQKLSDNLNNFSLKKQKHICRQIGETIAKLHDNSIIHGDLTTSNMILVEDNNKLINKKTLYLKRGDNNSHNFQIYFIDFGLGFISNKHEDKAVDLHLLKQALEAKHFKNWEILVKQVFKGYQISKDSKIVLERLKAVEKRGRYKH